MKLGNQKTWLWQINECTRFCGLQQGDDIDMEDNRDNDVFGDYVEYNLHNLLEINASLKGVTMFEVHLMSSKVEQCNQGYVALKGDHDCKVIDNFFETRILDQIMGKDNGLNGKNCDSFEGYQIQDWREHVSFYGFTEKRLLIKEQEKKNAYEKYTTKSDGRKRTLHQKGIEG